MGSVIGAIALAVVGVACAAYGLKYVLSETKVRFHVIWLILALVLVAPAALMAAGVWDRVPAVLRWAVAVALLAFAVFELSFGIAIGRHYHDKAEAGLDYVAVFGAQVLDGNPGRTFALRLDAARAYLVANPHACCVVCGGQGRNESLPEAHAGRDYLIERGISAGRILCEARSHSTAENLRFAAELIDPARDAVGIVTNDFHVARSLAVARKAGMGRASGISVKGFELFPLSDIVRESFAWTKDILSGNA